jgi:small subunit ribosomal protein S6
MPTAAPVYDLMLLLSTSADEARRKQILSEVESAISAAKGSIERNDDWGVRGLTYHIAHQADAEYHLLQLSGPPSLLESLSHSLRIADDVLRFRIIKVAPGTPPAPETPPPVVASVAGGGSGAAAAASPVPAAATEDDGDAAAPEPQGGARADELGGAAPEEAGGAAAHQPGEAAAHQPGGAATEEPGEAAADHQSD